MADDAVSSYTETYDERFLLSRASYGVAGVGIAVVAPGGASVIRVSLVGAGGTEDGRSDPSGGNRWSGGAAFARRKTTCSSGEGFTLQVGDPNYTANAGNALGDSIVVRNTGSVVIAKAERGYGAGNTPNYGRASASVGDVTRDGEPGVMGPFTFDDDQAFALASYAYGGASGSDLADDFGVGVGGRRAKIRLGGCEGSGGLGNGIYNASDLVIPRLYQKVTVPAGAGRIVVEFFSADPGYA